jgi:hypothetical protein
VKLPSGPEILGGGEKLLAFCREEYVYYDGIPSGDPNRVETIDVLVTVAVNSWITNAAQARRVHRGLAEFCDALLPAIPVGADLLVDGVESASMLIDAAVRAWGVQTAVATKVLHRKRRRLIPMIDGVIVDHYKGALSTRSLSHRELLGAFRADLTAVEEPVREIEILLATEGYVLTPVRILEVLLWTAVEPRGYYRADADR